MNTFFAIQKSYFKLFLNFALFHLIKMISLLPLTTIVLLQNVSFIIQLEKKDFYFIFLNVVRISLRNYFNLSQKV